MMQDSISKCTQCRCDDCEQMRAIRIWERGQRRRNELAIAWRFGFACGFGLAWLVAVVLFKR